MATRASSKSPSDEGLALAVIASSPTPLVLLDGDYRVVAASASFCHTFDTPIDGVQGRSFFDANEGAWRNSEFQTRLADAAAGGGAIEAYAFDLPLTQGRPRQVVVAGHKFSHPRLDKTWLLVSVADVTDAHARDRLKDELVRETGVLLQEVQHRTANSLQIVASLLLQSARNVEMEEARTHLRVAHGRVMSIAALQKQLAVSALSEVVLKIYLADLCRSLSAALIQDPDQIALHMACDDTVVSAKASMGLGLIVTEMVINAVKHAFPGGRRGEIKVSYKAMGDDWALTVSDDGVGRPSTPDGVRLGLGSGIISALAKQLGATVATVAAPVGHTVRFGPSAPELGIL